MMDPRRAMPIAFIAGAVAMAAVVALVTMLLRFA
jgi:hypothetical protein